MLIKHFKLPIASTVVGFILAAYYGVHNPIGLWNALLITATLAVVEISLSVDNAVFNAKYVAQLSPFWQTMFLTVGIFIAVFVVRAYLPLQIISLTTGLSLLAVLDMALNDPTNYSKHLHDAHTGIAGFGGMFLLMVLLSFLFDHEREVKWISWVERFTSVIGRTAKAGKLDVASIFTAASVMLITYFIAPFTVEQQSTFLLSATIGIMTYVGMDILKNVLESYGGDNEGLVTGQAVVKTGVSAVATVTFLEVLDASLSLDGVLAAFAFTNDFILIMIGLGVIGAMWVRSTTVYLVKAGTMSEYVYLEHAAHYGIGLLAIASLLGLFHVDVPEWLLSLGSIGIITTAIMMSIQFRSKSTD